MWIQNLLLATWEIVKPLHWSTCFECVNFCFETHGNHVRWVRGSCKVAHRFFFSLIRKEVVDWCTIEVVQWGIWLPYQEGGGSLVSGEPWIWEASMSQQAPVRTMMRPGSGGRSWWWGVLWWWAEMMVPFRVGCVVQWFLAKFTNKGNWLVTDKPTYWPYDWRTNRPS